MAIPLIGLGTLVLVLWVLATAAAIAVVMGYISGALSGLPFPLDKIAGPVAGLGKYISQACGYLFKGLDAIVGASWHWLARYTDSIWHQIEAQSSLMAQFGQIIGNEIYNVSGLRSLVHRLEKVWHGIEHGVRTLTKEFHGIEQRVHKLERELAHGIGNDVLPRLRTLEREIAHVEGHIIPAVESAEQALQSDVTALGEYVRANFLSVATDAITAAVAVALGAMGLGGLRCNTLLRSLANRGCGLWSGLENLLGLFVDLFIVTDLCEVIPLLETAYSDVAAPAVGLLTQAIDAMPCVNGQQATPLNVPALSLPSSPSLTLNLP